MNRPPLAGLALAPSLTGCVGSDPTTTGEWKPVSAKLGGQAFAVENLAGATRHLTPANYEFLGDKGTYTVLSPGAPRSPRPRGTPSR